MMKQVYPKLKNSDFRSLEGLGPAEVQVVEECSSMDSILENAFKIQRWPDPKQRSNGSANLPQLSFWLLAVNI